jgi:hypothetical protein
MRKFIITLIIQPLFLLGCATTSSSSREILKEEKFEKINVRICNTIGCCKISFDQLLSIVKNKNVLVYQGSTGNYHIVRIHDFSVFYDDRCYCFMIDRKSFQPLLEFDIDTLDLVPRDKRSQKIP